jgi:hypothetical protein
MSADSAPSKPDLLLTAWNFEGLLLTAVGVKPSE